MYETVSELEMANDEEESPAMSATNESSPTATAFGVPAEPEVNMIVDSACSPTAPLASPPRTASSPLTSGA